MYRMVCNGRIFDGICCGHNNARLLFPGDAPVVIRLKWALFPWKFINIAYRHEMLSRDGLAVKG